MAEGQKLISKNPVAYSDFFIEEVVESGIVLSGTEIKSIRQTAPNLRESFVEVLGSRAVKGKAGPTKLEAWLVNSHIAPYSHGNIWNHEPNRRRKLLLHRHQIEQLFGAIIQKGMTIIPTKMYFKNGFVKLELGLAKGKKKHDKRQDLKKKSAEREMSQALKKGRR